MSEPPQAKRQVPEQLRECFCYQCGLVASSWFHRNFLITSDGFLCVWCGFHHNPGLISEPKPDGPYVPVPRW